MKLFLGLFGVLPAALLLIGAGGIRPSQEGRWRTDWEKARIEAKQAGKPLFVVFR